MPSIAEQSDYYDERWETEAARPLGGLRLHRAAAILGELADLPVRQPRILDFGCGTGNFTAMLSQIGDVTGVELSPRAVEIAKRKYPQIDFRAGNAFEIGIEPCSFDVLILQEVIEHVDDQLGLLLRCRDLLKVDGILVLTTPNKTIVHQSGVFEKAKAAGTLQPIENLLTYRQARNLVAKCFVVSTSRTIIPVGNHGLLGVINSSRLTRFPSWRAFQSYLNLGLHTVVVGRKTSSS